MIFKKPGFATLIISNSSKFSKNFFFRILAKSKGSSNPHNLVKATLKALLELRDARTVAMQRGITMEKVFNG